VTSAENGRPTPHRANFEYALHASGTAPSETPYVSDSYVADYLGATGVGMAALLIDPRPESAVRAHDRIIDVFETQDWLGDAVLQQR
jgi:FMN phosphatase YigB (HAD superfamily)